MINANDDLDDDDLEPGLKAIAECNCQLIPDGPECTQCREDGTCPANDNGKCVSIFSKENIDRQREHSSHCW